MVRLVAIAALLAGSTGCLEDRYRCDVDSDCDMGDAGRCEANHRCSVYDSTCDTRHIYTPHAGEDTGVCFDDRVALPNLCTGGQPPALPEGCAADVCAATPSCCDIGWTDACVEQAQLRCAITCETLIAITATKAGKTELWDLRWDGTTFSATTRADLRAALSWLAPAPGDKRPRLGGIATDSATFVIDDQVRIPVGLRDYQDVSSLDFDRDGRETIVMSSNDPGDVTASTIEVVKLATGATRTIATMGSLHPSWGDHDHDGFLDAVTGAGPRYLLADSSEGDDHQRSLVTTFSGQLPGGTTMGSPQLRSVEWNDLDGDGRSDLIAAGNAVRIHLGTQQIINAPDVSVDCMPPSFATGSCVTTAASFTAVAMPSLTTSTVVIASFPDRALWRIGVHGGVTPTFDLTPIPLPPCAMCAPFIALVARDLDGDRKLDLIAIDADLRVSTALSTKNGAVTTAFSIPTTTRGFTTVAVSVAGATP